jgi:hypothetical protein
MPVITPDPEVLAKELYTPNRFWPPVDSNLELNPTLIPKLALPAKFVENPNLSTVEAKST